MKERHFKSHRKSNYNYLVCQFHVNSEFPCIFDKLSTESVDEDEFSTRKSVHSTQNPIKSMLEFILRLFSSVKMHVVCLVVKTFISFESEIDWPMLCLTPSDRIGKVFVFVWMISEFEVWINRWYGPFPCDIVFNPVCVCVCVWEMPLSA